MSARQSERPASLGKRVATYRSSQPSLLSLGMGVGLTVLSLVQVARLVLDPELWIPTGFVITPAVIWVAWALNVPRRVDLYQHGMDCQIGRRHEIVFWNQIYEIYQTPLYSHGRQHGPHGGPNSWMYRLVRRDGRSLRLCRLESIHSLGQRMQEQVTRRHLRIAQDAFRAGYSIRFGRHVAISQSGLRMGRRIMGWHEIEEIVINESRELRITLSGGRPKTRRIAIGRIPNLLLLDGILRANQDSLYEDPSDADPQRGAIFEAPSVGSSDEESSPYALLAPENEHGEDDPPRDGAHPNEKGFRPKQPK